MQRTTVVVGMSGGVDSSVSALLLKQAGYHVIGMFMKNWEESDENGECLSAKDYEDVVRVCDKIHIPYFSMNFVQEYQEQVFSHFLNELKKGLTPNPDILCNREIKFLTFLEKAFSLGADFLATGHYCQIGNQNEKTILRRGADESKDQSYFLYTLKSSTLKKVIFPIGHLEKTEVRKIAKDHGLPTAEKKDSTGICFIGKRNFREFLSKHISQVPGLFIDIGKKEKIVGTHPGIAYYTIGQRRGIAIGGTKEPYFVVKKDVEKNIVYLAEGKNHPALFSDTLTATDISWIQDLSPSSFPYLCTAKIRYRQKDEPCIIEKIENDQLHVRFLRPQRAITPRQSIVFYQQDECLGGAMIENPGPSYFELGKSICHTISDEEDLF